MKKLEPVKIIFVFVLFFVFIFSFSSSVYALNEPITYTVSCVNYSPITVSSDGNIISGLEQIPEIHKLAFADKLKEYIRQWETMNTEQQRVALSLISQYYGFTCTIKNNEANTEVSAESLFTPVVTPPIVFTPEVGFPGFSGPITVDGFLFGKFIFALFTYSIYLSGVLAVIFVSIAGFKWVSAGGNQSKITEAKNQLVNSITGMFLVFATFIILSTINEDLVIMKEIKLEMIDPVDFDLGVDINTDVANYDGNYVVGDYSGPIVPITLDTSIMFYGSSGVNFKTTQGTKNMFLKASECVRQKSNGKIKISVNSVYRPGQGGTHSTGHSLDLQTNPYTKVNQFMLMGCMYENGFWNYVDECWHFTSFKASGSYSRTFHTNCCIRIGGIRNEACPAPKK